jgi:hypothetical protein
MKRIIVIVSLIAIPWLSHGQGTVIFYNKVSGQVVTRVYSPSFSQNGTTFGVNTGNTATDTPAGTQTYTGVPLAGSGWTAQIFSIPGSTIPTGSMHVGVLLQDPFVAAAGTTTFRTGANAGFFALTTATLANVPANAASAVLQVRVYPSIYSSWAQALAAWDRYDPNAEIGASPMFVVNQIGGDVNTPPNLLGLQSFSLANSQGPEPSSISIFGLGLATLAFSLRRKPAASPTNQKPSRSPVPCTSTSS